MLTSSLLSHGEKKAMNGKCYWIYRTENNRIEAFKVVVTDDKHGIGH